MKPTFPLLWIIFVVFTTFIISEAKAQVPEKHSVFKGKNKEILFILSAKDCLNCNQYIVEQIEKAQDYNIKFQIAIVADSKSAFETTKDAFLYKLKKKAKVAYVPSNEFNPSIERSEWVYIENEKRSYSNLMNDEKELPISFFSNQFKPVAKGKFERNFPMSFLKFSILNDSALFYQSQEYSDFNGMISLVNTKNSIIDKYYALENNQEQNIIFSELKDYTLSSKNELNLLFYSKNNERLIKKVAIYNYFQKQWIVHSIPFSIQPIDSVKLTIETAKIEGDSLYTSIFASNAQIAVLLKNTSVKDIFYNTPIATKSGLEHPQEVSYIGTIPQFNRSSGKLYLNTFPRFIEGGKGTSIYFPFAHYYINKEGKLITLNLPVMLEDNPSTQKAVFLSITEMNGYLYAVGIANKKTSVLIFKQNGDLLAQREWEGSKAGFLSFQNGAIYNFTINLKDKRSFEIQKLKLN